LLRLGAVPLGVVVALVVAWKLGYFELERRRELAAAVERLRGVPGVETIYVAAFAVAIAIVLPAWIMSLLGGALFGAWQGAILAWLGALGGTVLAHVLARYVVRTPMRRLFGEHRLLRQLREHDDVMSLLRLRIMPVAPFAVLDYVAGVSGVSLPRLVLATMLGIIPSVIAYTYVGSELMRGIISQNDASRTALWIAGGVTVGMLLVSLTPGLIRRLRD
jgi:uncharacterized membrane protein YdjX (TVP38/TMEM64 family)